MSVDDATLVRRHKAFPGLLSALRTPRPRQAVIGTHVVDDDPGTAFRFPVSKPSSRKSLAHTLEHLRVFGHCVESKWVNKQRRARQRIRIEVRASHEAYGILANEAAHRGVVVPGSVVIETGLRIPFPPSEG